MAPVPLNNTRQQIKSWSPQPHHNDEKWTTNSPPIDGGLFRWEGQNIWSTTTTINAWYLLGPRWGGAQDNEFYGGISIKIKKAKMRKSEFLML